MPGLMALDTGGLGDREKFQGGGKHTVLRSPEDGKGWGPLRDGSEGEAGLPWRKGQQFLSGDVWQVPWVLPRTQKSGALDPDPAAMSGRGGAAYLITGVAVPAKGPSLCSGKEVSSQQSRQQGQGCDHRV